MWLKGINFTILHNFELLTFFEECPTAYETARDWE